jgi:hypothetical protein
MISKVKIEITTEIKAVIVTLSIIDDLHLFKERHIMQGKRRRIVRSKLLEANIMFGIVACNLSGL